MSRLSALALLALPALILSGCATSASAEDDGIHIVASTNVYGQIASEVGGDRVVVTSIISSAAQDPHEYEPSSRDKLEVSKADLIVTNGGGYDSFIEGLITNDEIPVVEAINFAADLPEGAEGEHDHEHEDAGDEHATHEGEESTDEHATPEVEGSTDEHATHEGEDAHDEHGHEHIAGFNEHVWYDPDVAAGVATDIAEHLAELDPEHADEFRDNAKAFAAEVETLHTDIDALAAAQPHTHIVVTEPVALRLTDSIGFHNVTPAAFTEAVEEGQDVSPATLLETLKLLEEDDVSVVIANTQTGGAETDRLISDADKLGIPVLEFSEVLPDGKTYIEWMSDNVTALEDALGAAE